MFDVAKLHPKYPPLPLLTILLFQNIGGNWELSLRHLPLAQDEIRESIAVMRPCGAYFRYHLFVEHLRI